MKGRIMPFPKQTPRAFTRANVEMLDPNQIGVYGLLRQNVWVYIGKGDIRQRLLDHLDGDNPWIIREKPTHWFDEVTNGDPSRREESLIIEYRPICNKRVG
jgi:hypothetical protein